MNNTAGRALYRIIDLLRGEEILKKVDSLLQTQFENPEILRAFQQVKLQEVLKKAMQSVPFYRERFSSAGLTVADLETAEALQAIPVLTKSEIQEAGDSILHPSPTERFHWEVTSGSTGAPFSCRRSLSSYGWHRANNLRSLAWFGVHPGEKQARIWGVPIRGKDRRREAVKDFFLNRKRISAFDLNDSDLTRNIRRLASFKPSYLYGYPSTIHSHARYLLEHGTGLLGSWKPRVVMTTAEMLFHDQSEDIGNAFGCPVSSEYGASELTVMASTCPEGVLHLNDESIITEFQPTGLVIDDKPAFRLVFTDLNNLSMPMIRYRIGDLGRPVDSPCPCGRGLAVIEILGGREVDVLLTPSRKKIHGSIFSYLGKSILIQGGVKQFRAIQKQTDLLEIDIVKGETFQVECLEKMKNEVLDRTDGEVRVEFRTVGKIEPEASGKLRYFIGLVRQTDTEGSGSV